MKTDSSHGKMETKEIVTSQKLTNKNKRNARSRDCNHKVMSENRNGKEIKS
jgi:hypothetical protein